MRVLGIAANPYAGLAVNFAYAAGNCAIGLLAHSWWFTVVGAYYAVLASARFSVLELRRRAGGNSDMALFAGRVTGMLLIALSFCLVGINVLAAIRERGTEFHKIVMIAIAVCTFTKITIAAIGVAKARHAASSFEMILRNISFADAFVSVYALQRSMLVSFPGMEANEIQLMNILTGTAVWLIVLFLGINLTGGKIGYGKIENHSGKRENRRGSGQRLQKDRTGRCGRL